MRVRTWVVLPAAFVAAAVSALLSVGCNRNGKSGSNEVRPVEAAEIGSPLYAAKPDVHFKAAAVGTGEPLIIPNCSVQFDRRQQVAAELDGKIDLLAVRDDSIDPKDPACIYHPRDVNKQVKYRTLKEGETVKANEVVCLLDDQLIGTRLERAMKTRETTAELLKQASAGVNYSKEKLKLSDRAVKEGSGSFIEFLNDQITLTRFEENLAQAGKTIAEAESDYKEAQVTLAKHQVRSTFNGIARNITRQPGDVVKAGEKIMEIQATDLVRLEGQLDVQYADLVKRGMTVTVEPAVPSAPFQSHFRHVREVTGVAVGGTAARPLIVSVSTDASARVWDATKTTDVHTLAHAVPLRAVACSPIGSKAVVAVIGADDGKVRVWDLSNPDKLPAEPKELADAHTAGVAAIAFSPDGRYLATAAGRDVFVWDAIEWKKLYALPAEHRDAVTFLQFTPQCTLVTAAKDRSLKVWKLGTEGGTVLRTIDHRAGVVDVLAVTKDGGRAVFDQDKSRLDLIGLADRQTVGQVQNPGPTAAFATLALFNRDDTLLLTAGGEGELKGGLQVWTVPPGGGRGAEAARLFTSGRLAVTAAAFSPTAEHPFLAVGTEKGTVHLWKPPADARKPSTGKVVNVDATDGRSVTVRVEMDNRELNLRDRSSATVIIHPEKK